MALPGSAVPLILRHPHYYHVFRHFRRGTVRRDIRRGGAFVFRDIGGSDKRPPLVCAVFSGTINCPLPLATALPSRVLLLSRIVTVAPASVLDRLRTASSVATVRSSESRRRSFIRRVQRLPDRYSRLLSVTLMLNVFAVNFRRRANTYYSAPSSPAVPLPSVFPRCSR